jgi:hypothetical protein
MGGGIPIPAMGGGIPIPAMCGGIPIPALDGPAMPGGAGKARGSNCAYIFCKRVTLVQHFQENRSYKLFQVQMEAKPFFTGCRKYTKQTSKSPPKV